MSVERSGLSGRDLQHCDKSVVTVEWQKQRQEIRANAHWTRDSISLISYGDCLGLSPVYFSENSTLSVSRSLK